MSLILHGRFEKDGQVVLRFAQPGGYTELSSRDQLITDLIDRVDFDDSFLRQRGKKLPEFDKVVLALRGADEDIVFSNEAFEFLFTVRAMQRSGVSADHLLKLVANHYAALEALDRSSYTAEELAGWTEAVWVTFRLQKVLEGEVKRADAI